MTNLSAKSGSSTRNSDGASLTQNLTNEQLLCNILSELKIMNFHLQLLTDDEITIDDITGDTEWE